MNKPIEQTTDERIALLRTSVDGEHTDTIDKALKRIHPDEELKLSKLKKTKHPSGETYYHHPESGEPIAELKIQKSKDIVKKYQDARGNTRTYISGKTPHKESLLLFSPKGHIDTCINMGLAVIPDEYEPIRVLTGVKEYHSPPKKRIRTTKTSKDENKRRTRSLKAMRAFKQEYHSAAFNTPLEESQKNNKKHHTQQLHHHPSKRITGKIKRDRSYKIPHIHQYDRHFVTEKTFDLNARLTKDMMKHNNGDYVVIQRSGNSSTTIRYNSDGRRLEQHTYNSEGELTKALGESLKGGGQQRKSSPMPSDRASALIARTRASNRELQGLKEHWCGLYTNIKSLLYIENAAPIQGSLPTPKNI